MAIVGFVSQKGGVGKSTLSRALAVEAARAGLSVYLADLDVGQQSQKDWVADRKELQLTPAIETGPHATVASALALAPTVDLLVIDGPARADETTFPIAEAADLVVLPTGASQDDLRPTIRVMNSLTEERGLPASKLLLALTRVATDAEAESARAYIAKTKYTLASGYLPDRPAYRSTQNSGRAVTECPYQTLRAAALQLVQALIDAVPGEEE